MKLFNYIKAAKFFPTYAPTVTDWKKKMTGKNGRGNPLSFSVADKTAIKKGIKQLTIDLKKAAELR